MATDNSERCPKCLTRQLPKPISLLLASSQNQKTPLVIDTGPSIKFRLLPFRRFLVVIRLSISDVERGSERIMVASVATFDK